MENSHRDLEEGERHQAEQIPPDPSVPNDRSETDALLIAAPSTDAPLDVEHAHPSHHHHSMSQRDKYLAVAVFTGVATLLYADQNLMAPNLTAIAKDLNIPDDKKDTLLAGWISAVFFLIGAPAAIGVGYLSGIYSRKLLLFAVVLLGEGPVILTYFVKTYAGFFILRALTGLSLGGCFPLVFSILGDLVGPEQRSSVSSILAIATGGGTAIGQGIAGFAGPSVGWRASFLIVGFPTIALAIYMLIRVKEPRRGETETILQRANVDYDETITWAKAKAVVQIRTNTLIILQGLPGSLPWGVMLVFFTDYLAQDRGLSVQAATLIVLLFGLGGAGGVILGGYVGDQLYRIRKRYLPLWMGGGVLAGIPFMLLLVNADLTTLPLVISALIAIVGGAVASIAGPCVRAILLNVTEPESRGVAVGFQSTLDDLGKGAGPALVAALVSAFGRAPSFNIATLCWIPCAALMLLCFYTVEDDERAMQHRLAETVKRQLDVEEIRALHLEDVGLSSSMHGRGAHAESAREHETMPLLGGSVELLVTDGNGDRPSSGGARSLWGGAPASPSSTFKTPAGDTNNASPLPLSTPAAVDGTRTPTTCPHAEASPNPSSSTPFFTPLMGIPSRGASFSFAVDGAATDSPSVGRGAVGPGGRRMSGSLEAAVGEELSSRRGMESEPEPGVTAATKNVAGAEGAGISAGIGTVAEIPAITVTRPGQLGTKNATVERSATEEIDAMFSGWAN